MLNNLSIRKKLALVALGPLLLLLALSALRILGDLDDSSDATDTQARATASALTGQLFDAVRAEAVENQNAVAISGFDLDDIRADTDAAIDRWRNSVGEFTSVDSGSLASIIEDLNALRVDVAAQFATETGAESVFEADTEVLRVIAAFDGMLSQGATTDARDLQQAADLSTVQASAAELQLLGMWAANAKALPAQLPGAVGSATGAADAYGVRNGVELPVGEGSYETLVSELAGLGVGDDVGMSPNDWRAASDARAAQLSNARAAEVAAASTVAVDAQGKAQSAMRTAGLLSLIGLILAIAAIVVVARTFTESLRVLRDEAAHLADKDLPQLVHSLSSGEPVSDLRAEREIDALGSDEFGEVAVGLGAIRQSAADLSDNVASLQGGIAETFVNLARRNQSLVDRQLEAIDTLEAEERDSDRLSLMYRVDHLATRMRRNAESLLVLADAKTPERHSPVVDVREVLRVAIGEVEDYRRIIPIALDELHVAGHRAQDLAHLLAELMENAAQHSPPGTAVDVAGSLDRSSGSYAITILDHGTGVDPEQRLALNTLLQTPPTSTLTISHSIGLQVVRRLAHSLGLEVQLEDADGGGIEATVTVPSHVVTEWAHTAATPAQQAPTPVEAVAAPAPTAPIEPASPMPPAQVPVSPPAPLPEVEQPVFAETPPPSIPEVEQPVFAETPPPSVPEVSPFESLDVPQAAPTSMDIAEPVDLAGLDSMMTSAAVEVPQPPVVPTIEMPTLDLPSFGDELAEPAPADPFSGLPGSDSDGPFSDSDTPSLDPVPEPPAFEAPPEPPAFEAPPEPPAFEAPPEPPAFEAPPEPPAFEAPPAPVPVASVAAPAPQMAPSTPQPGVAPPSATEPLTPVAAAPTTQDAAAPLAPVAETAAPAVTASGLARRQRQPADALPQVDLEADRTAPSQRTPDQVKNMLSRYKTGLERGRGAAETDGE